jgi:hypothetical protein
VPARQPRPNRLPVSPDVGRCEVIITYQVRRGHEGDFIVLAGPEMETVLAEPLRKFGGRRTLSRDPKSPLRWLERIEFPSRAHFSAYDDSLATCRKLSSIEALLDEILDNSRCDFTVREVDKPAA